jgi:hypothetical protein
VFGAIYVDITKKDEMDKGNISIAVKAKSSRQVSHQLLRPASRMTVD